MSIDQHELVSATHVTHNSSDAHHVHTSLAASPQNMFGARWIQYSVSSNIKLRHEQ